MRVCMVPFSGQPRARTLVRSAARNERVVPVVESQSGPGRADRAEEATGLSHSLVACLVLAFLLGGMSSTARAQSSIGFTGALPLY